MSDRALRGAAFALALAGAAIASYLTWTHTRGVAPLCGTGGCDTVQQSRYSELAGVPVAAIGIVFYAAFLLALVVDLRSAAAGLAAAAALFAVYLVVLQVAVIEALCTWCVVNDAIVLALALLAVLRLTGTGLARPG